MNQSDDPKQIEQFYKTQLPAIFDRSKIEQYDPTLAK